jgi:hypothetical protein
MHKKHLTTLAAFLLLILPSFALAAANNFAQLVGIVVGMIKSLIPLVIALSLLYFSWGLFLLIKSNSDSSREDAIKTITFGIVALFVMVSVWGLVQVLTSTFFSGGLAVPQLR